MPASEEMSPQENYGDTGTMVEDAIKKDDPNLPSYPEVEEKGTMVDNKIRTMGEQIDDLHGVEIRQNEEIEALKKQLKELRELLENARVIARNPIVDMSEERQDKLAGSGYPGVKKSVPEEGVTNQDQP